MKLDNSVITFVPNFPDILVGKLTVAANYALNNNDVQIFALALNAISMQLEKDKIRKEDLTTVNALFTKNGSFSMYEESHSTLGLHFSLAIYPLETLHNMHNDRLVLFAFVEELVHHYWNIEDETTVKYKVLEIVNLIDTGITIDMLKGWGVNGL